MTLTLTGRGPSHVTGEYPHAFASVSVRDFFVGLRPSCPTVCLGGHWWVAVVAGAELRLVYRLRGLFADGDILPSRASALRIHHKFILTHPRVTRKPYFP